MFLEPKKKRNVYVLIDPLSLTQRCVLLYEYVKTAAYCNAVVAIALAGMG